MISEKKGFLSILPIIIGIVFICKLFCIQVLEFKYKYVAKANFVKNVLEIPPRGMIEDRNGKKLVLNTPVYDILAKPKSFKDVDLEVFCRCFAISLEDFNRSLLKARKYSNLQSFTVINSISHQEWASVQEKLDMYSNLTVMIRLTREYPYASLANTLGYIAEVNAEQLDSRDYIEYASGDAIGVNGLEKFYENDLRGTKGVRYKIVDVNGVDQGGFADGKDDIVAIPGKSITTTIDLDLQLYGEFLMQNKKGCIIALEPETGEILAIVSSPSYDPNLLSGKDFSNNFKKLAMDPNFPLFHRPIMATYPPGSIFKLVQALIALQMDVVSYNTHFSCDKSYINCHNHPGGLDLCGAIQHSCNPYFGYLFKKIINRNFGKNKFEDSRLGLDKWTEGVKKFGFGGPLGIDIPEEKSGFVPNSQFYDKVHGFNCWKLSTIRSLDIGQGELLITPLQMANLAVIIANRGFYYKPHLVKKIGGEPVLLKEEDKHILGIEKKHFEFFANAMQQAVEGGTAARMRIKGIEVCAKTGTAQNPHGEDHSVCIAFAPKNNAKIAIAVYVENAGWGPRAAAATAGLMIEFYLNREVKRLYMQEYVVKGNFK